MQQSIFRSFYQMIVNIGSNLQSLFLLAIRLFWGGSFFMSGLGKLQNIHGIAEFFSQIHIPFPLLNAYLVGVIECVGGACLFLGLGARLSALLLIIVMITALLTANFDSLSAAYDDPQKLITNTAFVYLFACLVVFIFGPGKVSIDYLLEKKIKK